MAAAAWSASIIIIFTNKNLLMYIEVIGEHIPSSDEVVLDTVDCKPVHAEVLRQERLAVPLHYILETYISINKKYSLNG